ncbi:hypothetical protein [Nocardia sp. NPDC051463]|uniref:hypothetical protein n=1 Tax=Nocardia sp. NPDC051463 TaxID=3154845 RepID=UPI003413BE5B
MAFPYGQPGYPDGQQLPPGYPPQPAAGGGTGITAGVLALVSGGLIALGAAAAIGDINYRYLIVALYEFQFRAITSEFLGFLLILGGILLLRRTAAGRVIAIIGCSLTLVAIVISATLFQGFFEPLHAVGMLLMLTTIALAAATPTGRWIAARPGPGSQPVPVYGQPPVYGQSPTYSQPPAYGQPTTYPQPIPSNDQSPPQPYGRPPAYGQPAPGYGQPDAGPGVASPYGQPQQPYPYDQPPSRSQL